MFCATPALSLPPYRFSPQPKGEAQRYFEPHPTTRTKTGWVFGSGQSGGDGGGKFYVRTREDGMAAAIPASKLRQMAALRHRTEAQHTQGRAWQHLYASPSVSLSPRWVFSPWARFHIFWHILLNGLFGTPLFRRQIWTNAHVKAVRWGELCTRPKVVAAFMQDRKRFRAPQFDMLLILLCGIVSISKTPRQRFFLKPQRTREACVRMYKALGLSSEQIFEIGAWKNSATLGQFYSRFCTTSEFFFGKTFFAQCLTRAL